MRRVRHRVGSLALVVSLSVLAACGREVPPLPRLGPEDKVLAFGDSLTYGTGAAPQESYPEVLARVIGRTVVASGVPGETTTGGLARLDAVLEEHQPRILLLCLGGNDMLRKVGAATIESNLRKMVEIARRRGIAVVMIAVPEPALFGGTASFYRRIADDFALPLEDEVLNDVLKDNRLKSDPIHPNAEGYRRVAEAIADLLREAGAV
ncbi:MAG TPA: arylesterase [Burkholderiales bacterium]|nr:arylesterase [Burkholderiales bacterium]